MYYQAFDVLNQLNKLTIGGVHINEELKKEIFNEVYRKKKKVGVRDIAGYLVRTGKIEASELKERPLGGFDAEEGLKASLSSYVLFKDKFGELVDVRPDIFEDIILRHTVSEDKKLVESYLAEKYADVPEIIERLSWLKGLTGFKTFGRLSKKFITGVSGGEDACTGEQHTLLNRLYHTNLNLNQLLYSEEYRFRAAIDEENLGRENDEEEDVEAAYLSPSVRRGVKQALMMTEEYVQAVGRAPDKIFVEVTREKEKKPSRKESRKKRLEQLYAAIGKDCEDIERMTQRLNRLDGELVLRSERLYLYFLQLGRCAYTGEKIDIDELSTDIYDVDHIIPRSKYKDDGLDNKVLVKREKNKEKADVYPLPAGFTSQKEFWKLLKDKGLMSGEKYARLTRTKPLDNDDLKGFISRQLVVTSQSVKAITEILKRKYGGLGTKVVYSKASNVDEFKKKYGLVKCRETNDLHHARDAYLNIVVGNVYDERFPFASAYYRVSDDSSFKEYNLEKLFDYPVGSAWRGREAVAEVKAVANRTSMAVTRYSYVNNDMLFNATVRKKGDKGIRVPRKESFPYTDVDKYGGYTSLTTAYFAVVASKGKKGEVIKTIEAIPVIIEYKARKDKNAVIDYLSGRGLKEPQLLIEKIKTKALVSVNGFKAWIAGTTGKQIILHNAVQWFTSAETDAYFKRIAKLCEYERDKKLGKEFVEADKIPLFENRSGVRAYATKESNLKRYEEIISALSKKCYDGLSAVKTFTEKLEKKKEVFLSLTTFKQFKVLLQLARFMRCNAELADLSLLNEGEVCGKLRINSNITKVDFAVIHRSPCGLIERIEKA